MNLPWTRRDFLSTSASGGALFGLGPLLGLKPVSAEEARLDPRQVRPDSDILPLVRVMEDTPREKILEEIAARVRRGLSYREVLAALLLANVRSVQPKPVGFKFHSVLVVNSAHLASLSSPDADRWLPIFWALDNFKSSQAEEARKTGWKLGPVEESAVPPASRAKTALIEALDRWDEPAADAAIVGLVRSAGSHEIFEILCRTGVRDWRDIGHKIIYVANAWRTLSLIGWQYAEPVLRSVTSALLYHSGGNPATSDEEPDRPGRRNLELIGKIRPEWRDGKEDPAATGELLGAFRTGSDEEMPKHAVELLNGGLSPASLWDAYMVAGGELVMRRTNILSIHALTTFNAMRYCYDATWSDRTRQLILLQAAAFVPLYRGQIDKDLKVDRLEPMPLEKPGAAGVEEIFAAVGRDKLTAARKVLAYLKDRQEPKALIDAARVLIFLKGNNAHDYKFSSAVLEDYFHVSAAWRDRYLASSTFYLRGTQAPDNGIVGRIRTALGG
jgi:hypothetical protein